MTTTPRTDHAPIDTSFFYPRRTFFPSRLHEQDRHRVQYLSRKRRKVTILPTKLRGFLHLHRILGRPRCANAFALATTPLKQCFSDRWLSEGSLAELTAVAANSTFDCQIRHSTNKTAMQRLHCFAQLLWHYN